MSFGSASEVWSGSLTGSWSEASSGLLSETRSGFGYEVRKVVANIYNKNDKCYTYMLRTRNKRHCAALDVTFEIVIFVRRSTAVWHTA